MTEPSDVESVRAEVAAWLAENWDPDLTNAAWWDRLARAGYCYPSLPQDSYGRGYSRGLSNVVAEELEKAEAVGAPAGLGYALAAPTIATHGTQEQKDHFLLRILNGQDAWCQLFSEPNAGSDLAGLQCKAERDGDEFVITGQKVWTSTAQQCNVGMLIARTDSNLPKHRGITYFAFDMTQPGVDVRPLREMTGRAMFNEVFIEEARVPVDHVIGDLNNGWAVANTTLMAERASLGSGGGGAAGSAFPGPIAGHLNARAGDFVKRKETSGVPQGKGMADRMIDLAGQVGRNDDPVVRQLLVKLYTIQRLGMISALRMKAGQASAAAPNIAKLSMSDMLRINREVGLKILGADGMLMGHNTPGGGLVQESALFSPGPSIYGGTDQIQRNIIGERVLGLPKEPGPAKDMPFAELPKNR